MPVASLGPIQSTGPRTVPIDLAFVRSTFNDLDKGYMVLMLKQMTYGLQTALASSRAADVSQRPYLHVRYSIPYPGDADADGLVDVVDLLYLVAAWDSLDGEPTYDASCDFDGDGYVGIEDLLTLVAFWGTAV